MEEMFDGGDELNSSVGVLPKPKKKVLPDDEESDDSGEWYINPEVKGV